MSTLRIRVLLAAVAIAVSCSSGGGDPTTPEPDGPSQASATIHPTGGSVTIKNADGVTMTLDFPDGALSTPTKVSLTEIDGDAGTIARFRLDPPLLQLDHPLSLTINIPDGRAVTSKTGLAFHNSEGLIPIDAEIDITNKTVRASLRHLGSEEALRAARSSPALPNEGLFTDLELRNFSCQQAQEALTLAILRAQSLQSEAMPPDLASDLIHLLEFDVLNECSELADSIEAASVIFRRIACEQARTTQANAQLAVVTTAEEMKQAVQGLLSADALARKTAANCDVSNEELEQTMEEKFNEFLDAYSARIRETDFKPTLQNWLALWNEVAPTFTLAAQASELGLENVRFRIDHAVFPLLFDRMRDVANAACASGNNSLLFDLVVGGNNIPKGFRVAPAEFELGALPVADLRRDLQRCGSTVFVESVNEGNTVIDSVTVSSAKTSATLKIAGLGSVVIHTNIPTFACGGGFISRPPIKVRLEAPGKRSVLSNPISGTLEITISDALTALDIKDGDAAGFDIVVVRDGSPCDIAEIPGTFDLYRVHMTGAQIELNMRVREYFAIVGNQSVFSSNPAVSAEVTVGQHFAHASNLTCIAQNPESQLPDSRANFALVMQAINVPPGVDTVPVKFHISGQGAAGLTFVRFDTFGLGDPEHRSLNSSFDFDQTFVVNLKRSQFFGKTVFAEASTRAGNCRIKAELLGIDLPALQVSQESRR